mmetsp:Transcript_30362/g.99151  ORF Transcript_30362/g.99151 Transcript_30362/m.99151 type:complete len:205 (-) Transcript_30362:592-1206(-)
MLNWMRTAVRASLSTQPAGRGPDSRLSRSSRRSSTGRDTEAGSGPLRRLNPNKTSLRATSRPKESGMRPQSPHPRISMTVRCGKQSPRRGDSGALMGLCDSCSVVRLTKGNAVEHALDKAVSIASSFALAIGPHTELCPPWSHVSPAGSDRNTSCVDALMAQWITLRVESLGKRRDRGGKPPGVAKQPESMSWVRTEVLFDAAR